MAAKPKNIPMCVITIGYVPLIMPADKGMKVVALLSDAFAADHDPGDYRNYIVDELVDVRYESIRQDRPRSRPNPVNRRSDPLLLERES